MLVCLSMAVLVVVGCAPAKAPPKAEVPAGYESIRMVGTSLGSAHVVALMALAVILNKYYPEIEWSSSAGTASTNVIYLTNGTIKLGFHGPAHFVDAYGFDKIAQSRLRSISHPIYPSTYCFLIPEDKPWKDITQVPKGLNLMPGTPGVMPITCEVWLNLCGLSKKDFNWLPMGKGEAADAWRAGKLDLLFVTISGTDPFLVDIQTGPRKIKAMGLSPEQAAKAKVEQTFERLGHWGVREGRLPELTLGLLKSDVLCSIHPAFLNCRDDFPEQITYKVARIIDEHNAELVSVFPAMKNATPQQHMQWAKPPVDIHAGVAKYYREKGYLK